MSTEATKPDAQALVVVCQEKPEQSTIREDEPCKDEDADMSDGSSTLGKHGAEGQHVAGYWQDKNGTAMAAYANTSK